MSRQNQIPLCKIFFRVFCHVVIWLNYVIRATRCAHRSSLAAYCNSIKIVCQSLLQSTLRSRKAWRYDSSSSGPIPRILRVMRWRELQAMHKQVAATAENIVFDLFPRKVRRCRRIFYSNAYFCRLCLCRRWSSRHTVQWTSPDSWMKWWSRCKMCLRHSTGRICTRRLTQRFIRLRLHLKRRSGNVQRTTRTAYLCLLKVTFPAQGFPI